MIDLKSRKCDSLLREVVKFLARITLAALL
jgi:hypothetical protein